MPPRLSLNLSARIYKRLQSLRQPYRCLSCTQRLAQERVEQDGRTTHFGFERVREAEKESKGK